MAKSHIFHSTFSATCFAFCVVLLSGSTEFPNYVIALFLVLLALGFASLYFAIKPLSKEQSCENNLKRNSILFIKLASFIASLGVMAAFSVSFLVASLVLEQNYLQTMLLSRKVVFMSCLLVIATPLMWKNLR